MSQEVNDRNVSAKKTTVRNSHSPALVVWINHRLLL